MDKLIVATVLVLVLGYTQARPYYYGYHVPWYPVSPCNPYPPPCSPYPYPCGAQPPPRPTPCSPQPAGPPNKPPPSTYDQQAAEEALLTKDISVRPVRQGPMRPWPPREQRPYPPRQYSKYPEYNTNEYRALKQKPYRKPRGRYGLGMGPGGHRDHPADMDQYDEEYEDYDRGMGRRAYRDEGDYGSDEDDNDDEEDYY